MTQFSLITHLFSVLQTLLTCFKPSGRMKVPHRTLKVNQLLLSFHSDVPVFYTVVQFAIEGMRVTSPSAGVPAVTHSECQKD